MDHSEGGSSATLRPYQQVGFDWLEALGRAGFGGLLADDMGLGKTVQTLAHIVSRKAASADPSLAPVLILAPTSVLPNWQAEIARFAPGLSVLLRHGAARHGDATPIGGYDVVLTSYPLLVRDADILAAEAFSLIVFDEAHVLKNPRTSSHVAAKRLKAQRRIALTGTPVENRLIDAWALFDLVVPGLLGSQRDFQRIYRTPIEKHGDGEVRARLARKLRPFLLRRTKDAVATDLPAKSVMQVAVTPTTAQMALHESQRLVMQQRVRDEIARVGLMRAHIMVLTALTRLRQVCCDPRLLPNHGAKPPSSAKLERLLELLGELIPEGRRIILFSQFTSMLDLIKPELDKSGYGWVELTGTSRDRRTPVARFQAGDVPLILVSLKAGGTGLNLTAADTVILYDPWWNPAVEAQAIDRAHRIGQQKPVFVYRMIANGTIEEKILDLQHRKAALADALWSDEAATSAGLTQEDIDFLLG
ncbi:DEAD/DEAH box helicase [uncultured Sphingomonas sp.]|uniref:DEAD/DEAH box helicase n=1 Tax=uncultured Sphingomonas sp. TaxID=158754 RepID=UPI002624C51C|nr:DEAD/DEAH box helicase [uncultured Sphingomonas sp.]